MAGVPWKVKAKSWSRSWHANIGIATAVTLGAIAISCPFIAHKGGDLAIGKALMQIHYGEFITKEWRWVWIDLQGAALLFLIASGWLIHHRTVKKAAVTAATDPTVPGSSVAIVHEASSPAASRVAKALASAAEARGMRAFVADTAGYRHTNLPAERWLFLITGEGASHREQVLWQFLSSDSAPRLKGLGFSVLGTGGAKTSEAAVEFDRRLEELGATRLHPQIASDAAEADSTRVWIDAVLQQLSARVTGTRGAGATTKAAPPKSKPENTPPALAGTR